MLEQAVRQFDGRDTDALRRVAVSAGAEDAPRLMRWASGGGLTAQAASWIIKAMVEKGRSEGFDAARLIKIGRAAEDWPTALHLLQLAQHWPDMADLRLGQTHMHHAKPMVRTWALDTFVRACLGGQGSLDLAQAEIESALKHGTASQKARARALQRLF